NCPKALTRNWTVRRPTTSPLLFPVTSRNPLSLPSLPPSIPYRQDKVRRRKDASRVGTAARGSRERLARAPPGGEEARAGGGPHVRTVRAPGEKHTPQR